MTTYYNENNPKSAAMLRQLIRDGLIAAGDVDERSIKNVKADDLKRYTQCHFFAGIGGWSIAARLSGLSDNYHIWTGSCPCQPFSAAGNQNGQQDERHLWPVWFDLIRQCRPSTILGEQVEDAIAYGWLDQVFNDMEAISYSCGAAVLPATSVGSNHERQRIWFVAHANVKRCEGGEQRLQENNQQRTFLPEIFSTLPRSAAECAYNVSSPCVSFKNDGIQHRAPILHALGNAIVPHVAAAFIEASGGER